MRKKVIIVVSAILLIIMVPIGLFYLQFINLDTYKWNESIISYGDIQYVDVGAMPDHLKMGKQIGKIEGEPSFRVWEIKGKKTDEYIVLTGFMFPAVMFKNKEID